MHVYTAIVLFTLLWPIMKAVAYIMVSECDMDTTVNGEIFC